MNTIVHAPLTSLDSALTTLISSLQTSPTYHNAPSAAHSILSADDALTSALQLLETHQQNHLKILRLRSKAIELEDKVRGIVRRAGEFRSEIESHAPGILDEDSEDEDEEDTDREQTAGAGRSDATGSKYREVDYQVLLNFARGIGKYNAEAAKAVEQQEQRLRIEAKKREAGGAPQSTNGGFRVNGLAAPATTFTEAAATPGAPTTEILAKASNWLNATSEERRVMGSMAFPSGERLRMGLLGQLQAIREESGSGDRGEEAVEGEIERLIAVAEGREDAAKVEDGREDTEMGGTGVGDRMGEGYRHGGQAPRARGAEVKKEDKKMSLDLDLYNESDDDDD